MQNALEIKGISKHYGDFSLRDISFNVPKGTIVGLIGENGAGKTTTINCILNVIGRNGGDILILGKDNIKYEKEIKDNIGVVFDDCHFPDIFTANEIESFMQKIYTKWEHSAYQDYLQKFGLPSGKKIKDFSRGMKVKLAFAVALSHNANLLILDEATSGLDPVVRDDVLDILLGFIQNEENAVLFSSHITSDLAKVADHLAFIHRGEMVFCKPKDELLYKYGIVNCGAADFEMIDRREAIAYRKLEYQYKVLVADRAAAEKKYKNAAVEPASIDDIILFYVKGERK